MDEMTYKVLNDKKLIARRDEWFCQMKELFNGTGCRKMELGGIRGGAEHEGLMYTDPKTWVRECAENLAKHAEALLNDHRFVPLCIEGGPYGVHFIDKIFGAEVFFQDGQWYNRYLKNEVGELVKPDLESNEVWMLAKEIAEAFLELNLTVPLFGMPTIASPLNIAVNLYGEEILVAMLMDPEAAHHDLQIINEVLIELHEWYREHIPVEQLQPVVSWVRTQPPGFGQICGCTTQLLSPGLYEEFIYNLDNALLGVYPEGGMIHLCGSHTRLLPLFAKMENLRSIQLNDKAAEELAFYVEGLREDQVIYLNTCEGMTRDMAMEIAKDKRMVIIDDYGK